MVHSGSPNSLVASEGRIHNAWDVSVERFAESIGSSRQEIESKKIVVI